MVSEVVEDVGALEALYGRPNERSVAKELDHVSADYAAMIAASPFLVLASAGPDGLDCSPRGDPAGFVRVDGPKRLLIPDRNGNNRIDTLRNILSDPRVALLLFIPGVGETLRVNGRARILVAPALLDSFAIAGKAPRTVIEVAVERVFFQCRKAFARSRLWEPESWPARRGGAPTAGAVLETLLPGFDGASYEAGYAEHMAKTIY